MFIQHHFSYFTDMNIVIEIDFLNLINAFDAPPLIHHLKQIL